MKLAFLLQHVTLISDSQFFDDDSRNHSKPKPLFSYFIHTHSLHQHPWRYCFYYKLLFLLLILKDYDFCDHFPYMSFVCFNSLRIPKKQNYTTQYLCLHCVFFDTSSKIKTLLPPLYIFYSEIRILLTDDPGGTVILKWTGAPKLKKHLH